MNKQERLNWIAQQRKDRLESEKYYDELVPRGGFDRMSDELEAMKRAGLYCGTCKHGNGCEHGVSFATHYLDEQEAKVKNAPDGTQYGARTLEEERARMLRAFLLL